MGEAARKRKLGVFCGCGNYSRFLINYYPDDDTHIAAIAMQKNTELRIVKSSVERTPMKHPHHDARQVVWITKCAVCGNTSRFNLSQVPFDRLVGYWDPREVAPE